MSQCLLLNSSKTVTDIYEIVLCIFGRSDNKVVGYFLNVGNNGVPVDMAEHRLPC